VDESQNQNNKVHGISFGNNKYDRFTPFYRIGLMKAIYVDKHIPLPAAGF
jgi:hypothetical protein